MKATDSNIKKTIQTILKKQKLGKLWIIDEMVANLEDLEIKDCSKGCDNLVYLVSLKKTINNLEKYNTNKNNDNDNDNDDDDDDDDDEKKIIIRIPKLLGDVNCPIMHTPKMQAKLLRVLKDMKFDEIDTITPNLLSVDDENNQYVIESYVPSQDLSELFSKPSQMNDIEINKVFTKIGIILKRIHSKSTGGGYGSLKNLELEGSLSNWNDFFEIDFVKQFDTMEIDINIMNKIKTEKEGDSIHKFKDRDEVIDCLKRFFYDHIKQYLLEFNKPTLVHADLCSNNIRINRFDNDIKVTGIIDFADSISGDGLYDIGRILSHVYGDWRFIDAIEIGYCEQSSPFNQTQIKMIIFYALSFCCWLLDISDTKEDILKYNQILSSLLNHYKNKTNK
ncbi:hypothetical protein RB653_001008 [Dictyostelium firmibasis]|uniref:Aminoglycoside phosphotransferase domain-containing protein n=1 Tax=Dictyostelium firmibasis TaxID=79012 RepID=A0AAN7YUV5_9MYCE